MRSGLGVLTVSPQQSKVPVSIFWADWVPSLGICYFIEFGSFTFSKTTSHFSWRWKNLFKNQSGDMAIGKITKVRRDALESKHLLGYQNTYRLIVISNDDRQIPLCRRFPGIQDYLLIDAVDQIRNFIGISACHFIGVIDSRCQ